MFFFRLFEPQTARWVPYFFFKKILWTEITTQFSIQEDETVFFGGDFYVDKIRSHCFKLVEFWRKNTTTFLSRKRTFIWSRASRVKNYQAGKKKELKKNQRTYDWRLAAPLSLEPGDRRRLRVWLASMFSGSPV